MALFYEEDKNNFLPEELKNESGSKSGSSKTTAYGTSNTNRLERSNKTDEKKYTQPEIKPTFVPVPELHSRSEYPNNNLILNLLKGGEESRKYRNTSYDELIKRQERQVKANAWGDFLMALGQIGGIGRAPVEKMDTTKTDKEIETLRAYKQAAQMPNENWLKYLLDDKKEFDKRQDELYEKSLLANARALQFNATQQQAADRANAYGNRSYEGVTSGQKVVNSNTNTTNSSITRRNDIYTKEFLNSIDPNTYEFKHNVENSKLLGGNPANTLNIAEKEVGGLYAALFNALEEYNKNYDANNPQDFTLPGGDVPFRGGEKIIGWYNSLYNLNTQIMGMPEEYRSDAMLQELNNFDAVTEGYLVEYMKSIRKAHMTQQPEQPVVIPEQQGQQGQQGEQTEWNFYR